MLLAGITRRWRAGINIDGDDTQPTSTQDTEHGLHRDEVRQSARHRFYIWDVDGFAPEISVKWESE